MKRAIALFAAVVILLAMIPMASALVGMGNFHKTQTYLNGQFADVKVSDWFASGVQNAYELGLMKGSSDSTFNPAGNLTVAEALAIVCRLHSIYMDNGYVFMQGNPWYQVYVDYGVSNEIVKNVQFDPTKQITREQFAYLMCGALPAAELNAINTIQTIPDVAESSTFGAYVYRMYRAGILTGSDKYGTFKPTTPIQRCEVATIVMRMADKSQRKTFTPDTMPIAVTELQLVGATYLYVGDTTRWTASVLPAGATDKRISWLSGNTGVATVDQTGTITGIKPGISNITAVSSNGVKKTVVINVVSADSLYRDSAEIAKKSGYLAACDYYEERAMLLKETSHLQDLIQKLKDLYADWQKAAGSPVVIESYAVRMEGSMPYADITIRNLTEKTVVAFTAIWTCLDAYGKETTDTTLYNGVIEGYSDHLEMKPHEIYTFSWDLHNNKRTHKLSNVRITKLAYSDGTTWER